MTFRRTIRKAIQSGSTVYATVEHYSLGLATVRLATNGARLTNLSTQGAVVSVGDRVIVDYSPGVKPIVRPLFLPVEVEEEPEISEGKEVLYPNEDWSCKVTSYFGVGQGRDPDYNPAYPYDCWTGFIPIATPTPVLFGDNYMWIGSIKYGGSCEDYDVAEGLAGMYNENDDYGQNYLEIKRTGRYLITGRIEFDEVGGNRTTGIAELHNGTWYVMDYAVNPITGEPRTEYNNDGYFWMGIAKNGILVGKTNGRITEFSSYTQGGLDGPYMHLNVIVWCEYGDKIELIFWENNSGPYYWPGWGYPASGQTDSNGLTVVYIPGSEHAIYQATTAQSAYLFGDARSVHAYLCGTIDGNNYRTPAYLKGGMPAGGEGPGGPVPDAVCPAYLEGI